MGLLNSGGCALMSGLNNQLLSRSFASGGFTSGLLGSGHCVEQNVLLLKATLEISPNQGCQVFTTKLTQLLRKTSPKLAQSHFEGGLPLKIVFLSIKYLFFWWGSPRKFEFQGLNMTLLGTLQPADIKNNLRQQC